MNFFKKWEQILRKSLFYGFIIGFYYSVLFVSKNEVIKDQNSVDNTRHILSRTNFDYVIEIIRTSLVISLLMLFITTLYLYFREKK